MKAINDKRRGFVLSRESLPGNSQTVIVTCGPSYEPIDEVRRITNFSTGELGTLLAQHFVRCGYQVICLRGAAATHPELPAGALVSSFTTNDDLASQLQALAAQPVEVAGVFHAAALCDYRVKRIQNARGRSVAGAKIASRAGTLTLELEPANKLIAQLRDWFPKSFLVGWKYELEGAPYEAIQKAQCQVIENRTDGCVVNGRAYGAGFGFVDARGCLGNISTKKRLCAFLSDWLQMPEARRSGRRVAGSPYARMQSVE